MSTQSPEYMPTPAPTVSSPSDTSSSPQLNADLSLPYDMSMSSPLAFLLSQNFGNPDVSSSSSSDSPESQDGSPREWAPIMWPEFQGEEAWKWTTQMDLDIFPKQDELVVNPSALHFNPPAAPMVPSAMSLGYPTCPQDILDFSFDALQNFSMNAQSTVPTRPPGLDMAPIAHRSLTPPDDTYSSQATIDDSDDVGRRAREAAGVTIAIQAATPRQLPSATMPDDQAPLKLPIPRLVRPAPAPRSQKTLLAPTSAHTPTLTPAPSPPASAMGSVTPPLGHSGRPKTSHTTIERRYRTNLNARIMALRHAVPALRVLNKEQFPNDIVDERGFVDGVRAARKASKASVLGKAVEYIR